MVIYEAPAEYVFWYKLLYIIPIGLFVGVVITAFNLEYEASLVLVCEGIFFVLLFYSIMPRRYQIFHDRLRIVLGTPFGINIPLSTIKEVRHSSGMKAFVYSGIRFAASTKNVIEIVRNKGFNYVISPKNGEVFKEYLDVAMKEETHSRY